MAWVTDIGCRSCGLWSHGFVGVVVVLGAEVKGFCAWICPLGVATVWSPTLATCDRPSSECELLLDGDLALHPKCVVEEDGAREVVRPFPDRYEQ